MLSDIIIKSDNIITCKEGSDVQSISGYIAVKDGVIDAVGEDNVPHGFLGPNTKIIDAKNKTVTPGLIDSHTHLIHAGSRENELMMKLCKIPYIEILKRGGGIQSTVKSTRSADKGTLKIKAKKSLDIMLLHGTTTVEAKSGYGLDFDTEIRCLEAARELNCEHPIDIISTYMGAHAVPKEYEGNISGYIDFMTDKVMPYIAKNNLAEFIDVFCEEGVFSLSQSETIMQAGKNFGFKLKIHADEIVPFLGAELASKMKATSAEHLLCVSENGIEEMSRAKVTAVLLPGTSFYLMTGKFAPARKMLDKGVRVAIATDYNPGTCPTENLQAIMPFACFGMGLTPFEIMKGMTINAAYAVDRANEIGSIEKGKKADIVIFDAPDLEYIIYHFGINHVDKVIKNGKIAVEDESLV